jgi:hypothetical protein
VASAPSRADHVEGGVLVSGTNGIVVAAGATDTVVLEGLDIDGIGTGLNGVQITSGLQVYIIRCAIRRFTQNGVNLVSNTSNARAIIRDSFISLNGSSSSTPPSTFESQGVGIFLNETDKTTLRLRTGEDHQGWVLTSIRGGKATFVKGERTATLALLPIGSAAQALASSIALGNTWRDGDGQMISAPPRREPKPASPMAAPSRNTWLDGDGQMISAPPKSPLAPTAVTPSSVDPVM